MKALDIVIIAVIAVAVIFAAYRIYKKRKSGCSCGCESCGGNCPMARKK